MILWILIDTYSTQKYSVINSGLDLRVTAISDIPVMEPIPPNDSLLIPLSLLSPVGPGNLTIGPGGPRSNKKLLMFQYK